MEALNLLSQRRSSRAAELAEPGPEGAALQRILEAGIRVPDHGKLGPWRLLVLQGATGPGPARGSRSVLRW